jgi:folate-dependent phosphoribosylglycinamide formyltransferase PurN
MLRIAWFTTARGEGSRNLFTSVMDRIVSGDLDVEIAVVFSNRERGEAPATDSFFDLVAEYGIPLVTLSSVAFRKARGGPRSRPGEPLPAWRSAYDDQVVRLLEPFQFELGVLAGYMLIATEVLCNRFPLLNLHPAAPGGPLGVWQDVIRRLIAERATYSGVQIQRVTPDVDRGPLVSYCIYPIQGPGIDDLWSSLATADVADVEQTPLFREIRRRGMAREAPLMVETLRAFAEGRLRLVGGVPYYLGVPAPGGVDLTADVERALAGSRT